jgi:N-methylhydantoinase A
LRSLDSQTLATVQPLFRQLAEDTRAALARYGFASEHIESSFRVDVRFDGQAFTIAVLVDAQSLEQNSRFLDDTRARFVSAHQRLYGHGDESIACEITTVRCRSVGRVHIPKIQRIASANASAASAHRDVFFPQQRASMKTAIFQRPDLAPGWRVYGPAIVEEWTTTTLVPPGWSATVDAFGNLILRRRGAL